MVDAIDESKIYYSVEDQTVFPVTDSSGNIVRFVSYPLTSLTTQEIDSGDFNGVPFIVRSTPEWATDEYAESVRKIAIRELSRG